MVRIRRLLERSRSLILAIRPYLSGVSPRRGLGGAGGFKRGVLSAAVAPSTILTNLVAYWKLDEASGSRADSQGTNTLTDNNTVTSAAGIISNAAQFTSANSEYLDIADNAALSMGNFDFAMWAWAYLDTKVASRSVLAKISAVGNAAGYEYDFLYSSGPDRFRFGVSDGTTITLVAADNLGSPSTATWYFISVYHDAAANTIGISVNNGATNTAAHTTGVQNLTNRFSLGRAGEFNGQYWNGRIDEVGIRKQLLTAAEQTSLYNAGAGLSYPF